MKYIYTMDYYSIIKKNEIMPSAATQVDLEIIILSEVNQTKKDKYSMLLLVHGILKNDTNELIYKTKTELQISKNKLTVTKMERQRRGKLGVEISIYTV